MNIGIVGAGPIGRNLAQLAVAHGHVVMLANSRGPDTLAEVAAELDCRAGTAAETVRFGDVVVLAIPFHAIDVLDPSPFSGKVVLDTSNHYPARDGDDAALDAMTDTTGERVQRHLPGAHVVKAFNAIMQADLVRDARPRGAADRRALPIAGDDPAAKQRAIAFIDDIGFDAVDAGPLRECWRFERAMPAYCIPLRAATMTAALAGARPGERLPHGSWKTPRALA